MSVGKLLLFAGIGSVITFGYTGAKYRAAVLSSVFEQMDIAKSKAAEGKRAEAIGYAKSLLLEDAIKVGVDYGTTPTNQIPAVDKAVDGAIKMWESALESRVKFTKTSADQGDIKIHFQPNVKLNGQIVSGYVNWTRSIKFTGDGVKPIFKADAYLRTVDPTGNLMTFEAMRHTCGHEFGHVLGLDDNPSVGFLMGPLDLNHPVARPTESEVSTIKEIRSEFEAFITETKGTDGCEFSNLAHLSVLRKH